MVSLLIVIGALSTIAGIALTANELSVTGTIVGFGAAAIGSGITCIWMGMVLDELKGIKSAIATGSTVQQESLQNKRTSVIKSKAAPGTSKSVSSTRRKTVYCPSCKFEIGPLTAKCPHCGVRIFDK